MADWFGKMADAKAQGTALPMSQMAERMMDGFAKLGITSASQITDKVVDTLGKALGVSAQTLQKATQSCPFAHGLAKLDG